jgi:hypothetical protein
MELEPESSTSRPPPWMCALAGWLLASAQHGSFPSRIDPRAFAARTPAGGRSPPANDPDRMSARELRRLPAIGPARALAIIRARRERGISGGPEAWEDLPGIGPETVRAIRRALDEAAGDPPVVRSP